MRHLAPLLIALTLVLPAVAQTDRGTDPVVVLPAEIKCKPGRLLQLEAQSNGKIIRWKCASEDADVIAIREDGRKAVFCSPVPGRFVVVAWTAVGDVPSEGAFCVVIVEGQPPGPNPPGPNPPGPNPPPQPDDPLVLGLKAAYRAETAADKALLLQKLAGIYRFAGSDYARRVELSSWGLLFDFMAEAARSQGVAGKMLGVQAEVQAYLKARLPSERSKPLDADGRALASVTFTKVADALEAAGR